MMISRLSLEGEVTVIKNTHTFLGNGKSLDQFIRVRKEQDRKIIRSRIKMLGEVTPEWTYASKHKMCGSSCFMSIPKENICWRGSTKHLCGWTNASNRGWPCCPHLPHERNGPMNNMAWYWAWKLFMTPTTVDLAAAAAAAAAGLTCWFKYWTWAFSMVSFLKGTNWSNLWEVA